MLEHVKKVKGAKLTDLRAFNVTVKVLHATKFIGADFVAIDPANVSFETYDAYEEHKPWEKTLIEGLAVGLWGV